MTHRRNRFLIKPDGNFMQALDVSTMLALLFTAVVSLTRSHSSLTVIASA